VTTPAGTPIHPQCRIIDGLSIRFTEHEGRDNDALPLRSSDSGRRWVVTGLAAARRRRRRGRRIHGTGRRATKPAPAPGLPSLPGTGSERVRRPRLARSAAFWLVAAVLVLFLAASAAPTPLYRVYQARWGFSATTLTAVFAVYVVFLLMTVLIGHHRLWVFSTPHIFQLQAGEAGVQGAVRRRRRRGGRRRWRCLG
jgi:hypothetical protein